MGGSDPERERERERGRDRGPKPYGKSQTIGILSNTGPDPLKNTRLAFIVGKLSAS